MKTKVEIRKLAIAMLSTAMFAACSESSLEPIIEPTTEEVAFDVAVKQVDTVSISLAHTRSGDRGMGLPMGSFEMSDNGNTIYANQLAVGMIDAHNNVTRSKTRGTEKTGADFYSSFGLYGYFYGESETWSSTMNPMISEEITHTSGSWKSTKAWPGGSKGTFFAWAPYSATGLTASSSSTPSITYTVPSTVSSQQDILVCKTEELSSSKTPIALNFKHALTAVRFVVGNIGYFTEIKSLKIENVFNEGTLEIGALTWTGASGSASYEITGSFDISSLGESNIGGELMFLMPQTLPTGAKLTVVMANGTNEQTFTANLAGTNWPMGNTVTYKLSVQKIEGEFKFEVNSVKVDQTTTMAQINVNSYYEYNDGYKIPVPWSVSNCDASSYEIGGNETDLSRTVTMKFVANTISTIQDATLGAKNELGTISSPFDLSTNNGNKVRETANCYVVNNPGYYKFPIVYGNGIVNGSFNQSAFNSDNYLTYDGTKMNTLSSPWIDNVNSATLVWQDAENLIDKTIDVIKEGSENYISFHISKSNIKQGNAVIAVKNSSGRIMWSWHIWVTTIDISDTKQANAAYSGQSKTFYFMPVPLGWRNSAIDEKTFTLSISQGLSGATKIGTVIQAGQQTQSGTCTFYQWGRKDPMPPSDGIGVTSSNESILYSYDENGNVVNPTLSKLPQTTLSNVLQNPLTFYTGENWENTNAIDLWNVGDSDMNLNFNTITKTVYDPSPVNFHIPPSAAFTGFTTDGTSEGQINGIWENSDKGWTFTNGEPLYWHAFGYRAENGNLYGVGYYGLYRSSGVSWNTSRWYLDFNSDSVDPQHSHFSSLGMSIRPVKE